MDDSLKGLARYLMVAANAYFLGNTITTEERQREKYPVPVRESGVSWMGRHAAQDGVGF
jgi:hypothetical protein